LEQRSRMNLRSASGRAANWFLGLFWDWCGVVVVFVVFILGEVSGGGRTTADRRQHEKKKKMNFTQRHKGTKAQRGEDSRDFRQDYRMGEDEQDGLVVEVCLCGGL
jgi:hypothetical protein